MRVEFDIIGGEGFTCIMPAVPRHGEEVEIGGTDYTVRAVSWIVSVYSDEEPYALVTLR